MEILNVAIQERQDVVRIVLPDTPEFTLGEWGRTLFVMPSGEVLMAAGAVGMELQHFLDDSREKLIPCIVRNHHLYFPTWWVARMKPEWAAVCAVLEERARRWMENELSRRES